jgi:hypothetical protein
MWILSLLNKNYNEMKRQGFKLTPEDIYNVNKSSLKDAIVSFGDYCTGEIVSSQGLLFTNHHCGFFSLQQHSSVEHDYLKNGFWAKSKAEEIPTPGLFVSFLVRIEDVSKRINDKLNDKMNEGERSKVIKKEKEKIISETTKGNMHHAEVQSFFKGNNFYLSVYERYNDVRMVGAPPTSIGRFGHEIDNWKWPRHTSDFCIFRVYMSPDGKPADYSEKNIPLKPKYFLPISIKGYKKGDFTMSLGYPGETNRFMTSFELNQTIEIKNKNVIKKIDAWLKIVEDDMKTDNKIRIQYASKHASKSSYWKKRIEQNKSLKRQNILESKRNFEDKFVKWVNADVNRKNKYGEVLKLIEKACENRKESLHASSYYTFCLNESELLYFVWDILGLYKQLKNNSSNKDIQNSIKQIREINIDNYKNYNAPTDKKITQKTLEMFYNNVSEKFHPDIYNEINGNYKEFVEKMFETSIFVSNGKYEKFLENPTLEVLENDLAFKTFYSLIKKDRNDFGEISEEPLYKGNRLYLEGIREMNKNTNFYPDANGTMRLSYGTVSDYKPRDAVRYNYYTTMSGIMEKNTPGNIELEVDAKLKNLYIKKDFGRYGSNGNINVCFTTNNDITSGNSGSPVINANGELIGLAFDVNSEAMSGDFVFDKELQKCIVADIRYILFIIEKYAEANYLIDEMKIVEH